MFTSTLDSTHRLMGLDSTWKRILRRHSRTPCHHRQVPPVGSIRLRPHHAEYSSKEDLPTNGIQTACSKYGDLSLQLLLQSAVAPLAWAVLHGGMRGIRLRLSARPQPDGAMVYVGC